MGGKKKLAALFMVAGTLATGLVTGTAGTAQAAVTVDPDTFYEIFPRYFNVTQPKCLDVPNGSSSVGLRLQVFHCHGSAANGAPQLWKFVPVGAPLYWIVNKASGRCLEPPSGTGGFVVQDTCSDLTRWRLIPASFDTRDMFIGLGLIGSCVGTADNSGNDHTAVTYQTCSNTSFFSNQVQQQDWALG
jgi:Ricin-type beta-trefoil lectin domain